MNAIRRFIEMGENADRIPKGIDSSDIATILDRYGLLCDDGSVSIAGALLFSEHPRKINNGAFLKIGEFDRSGILRREDIIDAPLILVPDMAVDILFDRYIPPKFEYEGVFRKLVDQYPRDGVRELIVNAVVHMDYRSRNPATVSIYPDKIDIFGFGGLPDGWTAKTLTNNHRSVLRNQTLANVFHDAGYVENWAQGIRKVMDSCKINGNPPPIFTLEHEGLSAMISTRLPVIRKEQETIVLAKNQKLILDCILSEPFITQKKLSEITGLSERTIRYNLSKMVDASIITRKGGKKGGSWEIVSTVTSDENTKRID